MYCIKCGNEINSNSKFCKYCGQKVSFNKKLKEGDNETGKLNDTQIQKTKKINYYLMAFKKFGVFNGRSSRREYWTFFMWNIIIGLSLAFIEGVLGIYSESNESVLYSIYELIIFIPSLSLGVRRMHDVNKRGWYILLPIYNFILTLRKGDKGDNQYGSDPKLMIN